MRLTSNSKLALETAMSLKSCPYELRGIDAQRNRIWFVDFDLRISRTHVVADLLDYRRFVVVIFRIHRSPELMPAGSDNLGERGDM